MIPVYKPYLPKHILKYSHDAIDSQWISSNGEYLNLVTEQLKEVNGTKYVLLTNNGTTAGHLMAMGISHLYGDKLNVIVPNNVYVAAWNVFKMSTDFNLIPIDSNLDTWNADYRGYLKQNPENNIVLIVPNLGNIINVPQLKLDFPNNIYIEDNCEGFLGRYSNKVTGSESLMSTTSFYGNKTITSGEGGALFTNNDQLFEYLNSVRTQGSTSQKFIFDKIGYNYRMTNIQAALLYGQLMYTDEILERKFHMFQTYVNNLKDVEGVHFQNEEENTSHSKWMVGLKFNVTPEKLKKIELSLYENGVETRPMFPPITYHKHFENIECNIENSKKLYDSSLIFPSYPELNKSQINKICELIKKFK
jgi:perosamine synthetase